MKASKEEKKHPMENLLRMDRIPHIWCPGCGIGNAVSAFAEAIKKIEYNLDDICVVSGIGCTGRVAGYIKTDSFHTTHGRALPFATGLKMVRSDMKIIVVSGDVQSEARSRVKSLGAMDFIKKPVNKDEIHSILHLPKLHGMHIYAHII